MLRYLLFFLLILAGSAAYSQDFYSDRGTPLIPPVPCQCSNWHATVQKSDSTDEQPVMDKIVEVKGKTLKRTYYIKYYDTTWLDICDEKGACKDAFRTRKTVGERTWFVDKACGDFTFSLPCCADKTTNVSDIAVVMLTGSNSMTDVTFDPPVISPSETSANYLQTVKATLCGITKEATISMVNPNVSLSNTEVPLKFTGFAERMEEAFAALDDKKGPCETSGNLKPESSLTLSVADMCCNNEMPCVEKSFKFSGTFNWAYGKKCSVTLYGCPYIASLDAIFSFGLSATGSYSTQTTCDRKGKICGALDIKASIGGGLGVKLAAGMISADLQLVASASANGHICVYPKFEACGSFNIGTITAVGTVSAGWGMVSHSVEYIIFEGFSTREFCY